MLRSVTMGGWPDSETSTQLWGWRPAWGQSSGEHVSCLDQLLRLQAVSLCLRLPCAYLSPSVSLQDTRLGARALREARTTSSSPDPEPRPQRAFSSQVPGRARDVSVGPPVSLLVASNLSPSTHPAHAQHTPSTRPAHSQSRAAAHARGAGSAGQGAQPAETLEARPGPPSKGCPLSGLLPDGPRGRAGRLGSQAPHLRPDSRPAFLTSVREAPTPSS